jgi:hypothetical protein
MKFTIKPEPLIRMVEMVGERGPSYKRMGAFLRLVACEGRVCIETDGKAAEMEAVIWEDGQCSLSRARLLNALKRHSEDIELTIEADEHGLQMDGSSLPVSSFSPNAALPAAFQIFFGADLGVVPRGTARPVLA